MTALLASQPAVLRLLLHADAALRHQWAATYWDERGITGLAKRERRQELGQRQFASDMLARALRPDS